MPRSRFNRYQPGDFDPIRVLAAMGVGASLGTLLAAMMNRIILNTPVELPATRLRAFYAILVVSGVLAAFAIESIRQLQEGSPEADYHRKRRGLR
jgi:hypothetical protein